MPSPDNLPNIYNQLDTVVDMVSQHLIQRSRRQTPDGTQFIDGSTAEQAITWGVVADATKKAIRKVRNAGADHEPIPLPFRIGIIGEASEEDILQQSQQQYAFPEVLRLTMAVYDCPTGGQLATKINSLRRKTTLNPYKFSNSAVVKWLQGETLPTPRSFEEITQALGADQESPLPIHALTARLLYRSYDSARREKDMQKDRSKSRRRRN